PGARREHTRVPRAALAGARPMGRISMRTHIVACFLAARALAPAAVTPLEHSASAQAPGDARAASVDYATLLAALRDDDLVRQWDAMQRFSEQADAPAALVPLLEEMRRSAPALDNNVGLAVELILRHHPAAACPMEPLLEALGRHVWNSQQKCAQALLP